MRALLFAVLATFALGAAPATASSPWDLLTELRVDLEKAGPITGRFQQTYIPAGFSEGDHESGHLSLWLPRCLRWNYVDPQQKSFLLCGDEVYFWNEDEPGGRHYRIDREEEPGLDLLLLGIDALRERYVAGSKRLGDGTYEIALALPEEQGNFSARIHLDPVAKRVVGLEYTDEDGNLTRFVVSDYQTLSHTALFQPPKDVEWADE